MTLHDTSTEVTEHAPRKKLRARDFIGMGLCAVSLVGLGYALVTSTMEATSRADHLSEVAASYHGIERVEYGPPKSFGLDVTVDGKTIRCDDPSSEELANLTPLSCAHGTVFINAIKASELEQKP